MVVNLKMKQGSKRKNVLIQWYYSIALLETPNFGTEQIMCLSRVSQSYAIIPSIFLASVFFVWIDPYFIFKLPIFNILLMFSLCSYSNDTNITYLKSYYKCIILCSCIDQCTAISCVAINSTSVRNQCIDDSPIILQHDRAGSIKNLQTNLHRLISYQLYLN